MKLFSVSEVASNREAQTVSEIKRLDTVNKGLTNKRHELERLEADFVAILDRQRNTLETELSEHATKINSLVSEVSRLESRKKQALIPLEEDAKKLETKDKELSEKEADLKKNEDDLDEKSELLQEKLSTVAIRESQVSGMAQKQSVAQQGIDQQKAQIALQAQEMSKAMVSTIAEFNIRENAVLRREIALGLQEKQLADKEKEIVSRENDFARREALLKDRFDMLERTKKNVHSNSR